MEGKASDERYRELIRESLDDRSSVTSRDELFRFSNSSLSDDILARLHEQWTSGHLMDVTLRVGDHRIRAQRNILSAVSRYFEALFSASRPTDDSTCKLEEIELSDVSGKAVEMLVQYSYTGSLDISRTNVNDLIRAANFLCIDSVTVACCKYLENNLTIENCLDVQDLAVSIDQRSLRDSVERFIVQNFKDLTTEDHVMKMPESLLLQLLERDDVVVMGDGFYSDPSTEEEKILDLVLRYVEFHPEERRRHLPSLLSRGVRLTLLSPERLDALKSLQLISSSAESLRELSETFTVEASEEEVERRRRPRTRLVLHHQKSPELAGPQLLQSEVPAEMFDDSELVTKEQCIYVTGIKVCTRLWGDGRPIVGGLKVFYNAGRSALHGCDGYGQEDHEFHLDGPDERIIAINASTGWLIDRITFASNRGRTFGPYGGYGGTQHYLERPCKGAYLAYVTGSVEMIQGESAVRHIRFVWGFYSR